jgi:hypothetical protein
MRPLLFALSTVLSLVLSFAPAMAEDSPESNIAKYKCSEFLQDVLQQKDGFRLLRSMMAIAWATGYAAAYQQGNVRADPEAFRLISAMLAADCAKNPNQPVISTAVQEIHNLFALQK